MGRHYAVFAPESHVPSPVPGWTHTQAVILIGPRIGAKFSQTLVTLSPGATSALPPAGVQRFIYALDGTIDLKLDQQSHSLESGGFAYVPADTPHELACSTQARLLVFEKPYVPTANADRPHLVIGREQDVPTVPIPDNPDLLMKKLLPDVPAFDMAMNIMAYSPGTALDLVEVHIMEHGLYVLEGQFIYRLDEAYHPVQAGDTIYMGPFCPQWCAAFGRVPARYLLYKDWHRDAFGY